jgi:hypothetical protein
MPNSRGPQVGQTLSWKVFAHCSLSLLPASRSDWGTGKAAEAGDRSRGGLISTLSFDML